MPSLEERVAYLEGQVSELSHGLVALREGLGEVDQRIRHLELRMDARFESTDRRLDALDARFGWVIGIQVTTLVAIVAALLARQ